jgi:GNAT superfamily N-acetyltransferase
MPISITSDLNEDDFDYFRLLHAESISFLYPFSTVLTADAFIQSHKLQRDPLGYFTLRKTIWKGIYNNINVAFTVITEKRGGSIKFGPTIVAPEFRNRGIGSEFRLTIEKQYADLGYRKAFSTTNIKNLAAVFYVTRIGYRIEAHLRDHFELGKDELVLGKKLQPKKRLKSLSVDFDSLNPVERKLYVSLKKYCNQIDLSFFQNIRNSLTDTPQKNEEFFIKKGRKLFTSSDNNAVALTIPKRGDCVKISPLALSGNSKTDSRLIEDIVSFYKVDYRKFYTFTTSNSTKMKFLQKLGFVTEGLLSEPYKPDVDMVVMSLFL